jgi:hypothetical protein
VYITQKQIEKLLTVMKEFHYAKTYFLEEEEGGGIGTTLTLVMDVDINGYPAIVKIEISGVEDW